jgi:hypothetical protein
MKNSGVYMVVAGFFYVGLVIWLSNRFWSRSIFIKIAPIFAPASYEWMLILLGIRDPSYLTFRRFGEMILLGIIFFIAFILARCEGQSKEKSEAPKSEK